MNWSNIKHIDGKIKLNLGARGESHPNQRWKGWIGIDRFYDKDNPQSHGIFHEFPNPMKLKDNSVDAIMSEHFIEHLTEKDVHTVLKDCHRVLKPNARIRIAVPDFNHPSYKQQKKNKKDNNPKHLSIWNYKTMGGALKLAGFEDIINLHYWIDVEEEMGEPKGQYRFYENYLNNDNGYIKRTPDNDIRNKQDRVFGRLQVTSLVIDAVKKNATQLELYTIVNI